MNMRTFATAIFFLFALGAYAQNASSAGAFTNPADCSLSQAGDSCTLSNGNAGVCGSIAGTFSCWPTSLSPTTGQIQTGAGNNQVQVGAGNPNNTNITNPSQNITLINPLRAGTSLESFLLDILQYVIRIGTIVVILMVVFVGYKFVVARGNDTKLVEARQMLLWTVVGALILLGSQAIALSIEATVKAISVG